MANTSTEREDEQQAGFSSNVGEDGRLARPFYHLPPPPLRQCANSTMGIGGKPSIAFCLVVEKRGQHIPVPSASAGLFLDPTPQSPASRVSRNSPIDRAKDSQSEPEFVQSLMMISHHSNNLVANFQTTESLEGASWP